MVWELVNDEPKSEGFIKSSGRNIARTVSNLATRTVGIPGDVLSLVNDYIAGPIASKITGEKSISYEKTPIGKILPTTEMHRKGVENTFGDYVKPHNQIEKFVDNIIEDTALIFNPLGKGAKTATAGKALAKSIGSNLLGETAKQVSGSEETGDYTKMGSLFFLSVLDTPAAAKQIGQLYKNAEAHLPPTATTSAKSLESNLRSLGTKVTNGRPFDNLAPSEKFVIEQIRKVQNLIKNDKININQAWAQKRSLNEELTKLYEVSPKKSDQQRARKLVKQVNGFINKEIAQYGEHNPGFYKPYKDADQAFKTIADSNFVSKWVEKNVKHSPMTSGLIHLFGSPLGTTIGTAVIPYQVVKLGYRISKSPTLAKIYGNALKSAAKEDITAFNKYLNDLDKAIQKEESEEKWEFID